MCPSMTALPLSITTLQYRINPGASFIKVIMLFPYTKFIFRIFQKPRKPSNIASISSKVHKSALVQQGIS